MSTPRRRFLGWLGAGGAFAAAGAPIPHLAAASRRSDVDADALVPVSATWNMAWVDGIKGKYRAVFDSPEVSEGAGLFRACLWRDQHKEVYGTAREEMSPVLVIRHAAIPLAMNDAYWARFSVGKDVKLKDMATKKWYTTNPIRVSAAGTPAPWSDYNLESFVAQGGTVLACNLAFRQVVSQFRRADKLDRAAAEERAKEHLIPGIVLQPSGIFAVLRAQELGCAYIMAS